MSLVKKDIVDVIREAIRTALLDTHTAIPAIVKEVDGDSTVMLQIAVKKLYDLGFKELKEVEFFPVPLVPVAFPSAGVFSFSFPVVAGDEGMLYFCEQDIKIFLESGKVSTPANLRKHALEDAVFVPTRLSNSKRIDIPSEGVVIKAGDDNVITITTTGINIKGDLTVEDVTLFKSKVTHQADIDVTGNVAVIGNIGATGSISCQGLGGGGGIITQSTIQATGAISSSSDVTTGTISLKNHKHTESGGGTTSTPF